MEKRIIRVSMYATLAFIFVAFGCSKNSKKSSGQGTASFKVQLNNSATELALATTSLTAKLGGVDLLADCTGDQPPGNCIELGRSPDPDIWVNAGCSNDIAQCTTSNTEFFELINPDAANAVLNSQGRSIEAGVYTKVRIYFLNNDEVNALRCNDVASSVRPAVPITISLPSSLTVADGESVTVTLNYDPSNVNCSDEATLSSAFSTMTATVVKN
jgi:hypothetical protein